MYDEVWGHTLSSNILEIGPEKVLMSGEENMALGLAIFNPESYATPKKTYTHLKHEVWAHTLSSNILEIGPEEILVSGQENLALGLAIFTPESYATPNKTYIHLKHEVWGHTLSSHILEIGPEEVLVSGQENMALGLEIFNPENYATPKKTYTHLKHEVWGHTLSSIILEIGPEEVLVSGQENMAFGLAIFNPESYATNKKTYTHLKHEVWGHTLSNNILEIGPEEVLVSGQKNMALGLAIFNPESYATPNKTYTHLKHEVWGHTLSSNILKIGPKEVLVSGHYTTLHITTLSYKL